MFFRITVSCAPGSYDSTVVIKTSMGINHKIKMEALKLLFTKC